MNLIELNCKQYQQLVAAHYATLETETRDNFIFYYDQNTLFGLVYQRPTQRLYFRIEGCGTPDFSQTHSLREDEKETICETL